MHLCVNSNVYVRVALLHPVGHVCERRTQRSSHTHTQPSRPCLHHLTWQSILSAGLCVCVDVSVFFVFLHVCPPSFLILPLVFVPSRSHCTTGCWCTWAPPVCWLVWCVLMWLSDYLIDLRTLPTPRPSSAWTCVGIQKKKKKKINAGIDCEEQEGSGHQRTKKGGNSLTVGQFRWTVIYIMWE